jgi:hypothetical protein
MKEKGRCEAHTRAKISFLTNFNGGWMENETEGQIRNEG